MASSASNLRNQVISLFRKAVETGTFNRVLDKVQIGEVSKGRLSASLLVTSDCCNILNMLHGGMSATFVDHMSTLALKSHFLADGKPVPDSVSIELSLSYLAGVREGETIRLETEAIRVGRTIAFLTATIRNESNRDRLIATGKHTKFLIAKK